MLARSSVIRSFDWGRRNHCQGDSLTAWVGAGCWWEVSAPPGVGLSTWLRECLHNMMTGFPPWEPFRRPRQNLHYLSISALTWKPCANSSAGPISHTGLPYSVWQASTRRLWPSWGLATTQGNWGSQIKNSGHSPARPPRDNSWRVPRSQGHSGHVSGRCP